MTFNFGKGIVRFTTSEALRGPSMDSSLRASTPSIAKSQELNILVRAKSRDPVWDSV